MNQKNYIEINKESFQPLILIADDDPTLRLLSQEVMEYEGYRVETKKQFYFFANTHCNEIQGYLFSPPVPAKDLKIT